MGAQEDRGPERPDGGGRSVAGAGGGGDGAGARAPPHERLHQLRGGGRARAGRVGALCRHRQPSDKPPRAKSPDQPRA